jgi:hypothetical protein
MVQLESHGACWTPEFLDCGLHQEVIAPLAGSYTLRIQAKADRHGGLVGANVTRRHAHARSAHWIQFGDLG